MHALLRFKPDNFTLALVATVTLASFLPASGVAATFLDAATTVVIALLFFLHGSKLSRQAIWDGIGHWRLHLIVTLTTFAVFPLIGWLMQPVLRHVLPAELVLGMLFLCALPATVQSAIALTALARGNVPAAVCSASGSTLMGIILTPLLVSLLLSQNASSNNAMQAVGKIALLLLLPFVLGHLARPWTARWLQKLGSKVRIIDQGSILLVVYTAFSGAVIAGLWQKMPLLSIAALFVCCATVLACSMGWCIWISRKMGLSRADEATVLFCGAQKSLVSGIPMAQVLFSSALVGPMLLPIMLFHPMQLMVSAVIAGRYARQCERQMTPP